MQLAQQSILAQSGNACFSPVPNLFMEELWLFCVELRLFFLLSAWLPR